MLSKMMAAALAREATSDQQARRRWGPAILEVAKRTKDAAAFNVAAHLYVGTDELAEIDQTGWDATGDSRFAASLIIGLAAKGTLTLDDPRLVKAWKQFPENSEIASVVVALTQKAGKPLQPVLIAAIKAEYTHFSAGGLLGARPRATALRVYFAALARSLQGDRAIVQ
jgi:hypothetical protein